MVSSCTGPLDIGGEVDIEKKCDMSKGTEDPYIL